MHKIEAKEINFKAYLPSELSECDQRQYIEMCSLIFQLQCEQITYDQLKTFAVFKLLNLKHKKNKSEEEEINKFANISMVSDLIDGFFEINEENQRVIKQYSTNNQMPKFKPLWKTYYGPDNNFMNITFGEYLDGLRIFHDFHATGDMQLLYSLAALFYRPKKRFLFYKKQLENYDGDIRIPYNENQINARAKIFKYAPIGFIYGTYLFFAAFQKNLTDSKIMWSGQEIDLSILFEKSTTTNTNDVPGIGMDSIAFTIADSGVFGTNEQVRKINVWQIIIRMYDIRRTDLEREKQERNAATQST